MTGSSKRDLARETATGSLVSVRQGWDYQSVTPQLDPRSLAKLVATARQGEARDYLTLAEEMEEADLYYRSVIGTRKLAVQAIEPTVQPAGDDAAAIELAAAVRRDVVDRPEFTAMVFDAMDAVAKGFSAIEIVWDTGSAPWRPAAYHWRDPRWFVYDRDTGRELRLLDDAAPVDGIPLPRAHKWIIHEPRLKSGIPPRGGLALPIAYYFLVKTFDVASWIAFVETFGYPIRLGKFPKNATAEDVAILKRAVSNLGRDVGAVVPDAMTLEIVTGVQQGSSVDYYQKLAEWADKQIAIGVLGQAATTEGTPGRLGNDDAQQKVRQDILRSDARQLAATLQRDLVVSYVDLNHGPQRAYPQLRLVVEPPEDVKGLVEAVAKLTPLGFRVRTKDLYERLRLSEPTESDEVLEPPAAPAAPPELPAPGVNAALNRLRAGLNAADPGPSDELQELLDEEAWEPLLGPIHAAVTGLAAECGSYAEMERRLPELLARLDSGALVQRLAIATMKARGLGDRDFAEP